jgi:pectate lyase
MTLTKLALFLLVTAVSATAHSEKPPADDTALQHALSTTEQSGPGSPVAAFPGAEGFGAYARGGRGGMVLKVTNLNDDGPGSFRAAVDAEGPRTILFDVAGMIRLSKPLRIEHDFVTIAGQSAPGNGITLRDHTLIVAANDVVIRYLRSRLGDDSDADDADAIWVAGGTRVILDHVSASWSTDESLSVSPERSRANAPLGDITVQWSFITESLNHSHHPKGAHGYGSLVRGWHGSRYSFHHNLWAHHRARMPRPGNYLDRTKDPLGALMDFRNNVFYNWGASPRSADGSPPVNASGYDVDADALVACNFINNSYRRGADSEAALAFFEANRGARAWFAGNTMDDRLPQDPWSLVSGSDRPGYRQDAAIPVAWVQTESAQDSQERVLREAGASHRRDGIDKRIVSDFRAGRGRIINSQSEVGGWPVPSYEKPARDSDGDGMPDSWERHHGMDPKVADGGHVNANGRTRLEDYLNAIVAETPAR